MAYSLPCCVFEELVSFDAADVSGAFCVFKERQVNCEVRNKALYGDLRTYM